MSRGSLNDAVRAAGYAMATSEELLDIPQRTVVRPQPEARDLARPVPQTVDRKPVLSEPRTLRTFFGTWAVWA